MLRKLKVLLILGISIFWSRPLFVRKRAWRSVLIPKKGAVHNSMQMREESLAYSVRSEIALSRSLDRERAFSTVK